MPGTSFHSLHILVCLLCTQPHEGPCHHPHVTDEKTGTACRKLSQVTQLGFKVRQSDSRAHDLSPDMLLSPMTACYLDEYGSLQKRDFDK